MVNLFRARGKPVSRTMSAAGTAEQTTPRQNLPAGPRREASKGNIMTLRFAARKLRDYEP